MAVRNICVIGSAHTDNILIARELLINEHTVLGKRETSTGGVGYNMATILKKLGNESVSIACILGNDSYAEQVIDDLKKQEINHDMILRSSDTTASYTAFHNPDGNMAHAVIDIDIYNNMTAGTFVPIVDKLKQSKNWVLDTNFSSDVYRYLATQAQDQDIYITISSITESPKAIPLFPKTKVLFGNVEEIHYLANKIVLDKNITCGSEIDIWRALKIIVDAGVKTVIATDGPRAVMVLSENKTSVHNPLVVDVKNVNGAGDSFAAATIDWLIQGQNLHNAISAGLTAAALRVQCLPIDADIRLIAHSDKYSDDNQYTRQFTIKYKQQIEDAVESLENAELIESIQCCDVATLNLI